MIFGGLKTGTLMKDGDRDEVALAYVHAEELDDHYRV